MYRGCALLIGAKQESDGGGEKQAGYIILETNYHLTAYTGQQWVGCSISCWRVYW